jgi:hypothetical protein
MPPTPPSPIMPDTDDLFGNAIDAAREAAIAAFAEIVETAPGDAPPELRLMLVATRGNPSKEQTQTEVRFAAPDGVATSHPDKIAIALSSMKAVAPDLYVTMMAGLDRGRRLSFGDLRAWLRPGSR